MEMVVQFEPSYDKIDFAGRLKIVEELSESGLGYLHGHFDPQKWQVGLA
jgi:hypothetical protein